MINQNNGKRRNSGNNRHPKQSNDQNNIKHHFKSKNMFYIFYTEYYEQLKSKRFKDLEEKNEAQKIDFELVTKAVHDFEFDGSMSPVKKWSTIPNYQSLKLATLYPGLIVGSGYPHDLNGKDIIKTGLSLDYVTGLPYIPGSSLKGLLKSCFPQDDVGIRVDYLNGILDKSYDFSTWSEICQSIFDYNDVFLGAYPEITRQKLLVEDFITPHSSIYKNPKPIEILKVKPSVTFEFGFLLKDSQLSTGEIVTVSDKLKLFKAIILDFGMGAKTNVGFGQFSER